MYFTDHCSPCVNVILLRLLLTSRGGNSQIRSVNISQVWTVFLQYEHLSVLLSLPLSLVCTYPRPLLLLWQPVRMDIDRARLQGPVSSFMPIDPSMAVKLTAATFTVALSPCLSPYIGWGIGESTRLLTSITVWWETGANPITAITGGQPAQHIYRIVI